jgi:tetratricopeptide (TPR) repeat protein
MTPQIQKLIGQAIECFQGGLVGEAEKLLLQVLKTDKSNMAALEILGLIKASSGAHLEAIKYFKQATLVDPSNSSVQRNFARAVTEGSLNYLNRGIAFRLDRHFSESIHYFDEAIAINPDYADAHFNRGISLQHLGRLEEALESYAKTIRILPHFSEAYFNSAIALRDLERPIEALDNFDHAIKLSPDHSIAHWNKALLLLVSGNFQQGWIEHEWRWKSVTKDHVRNFSQPLWLGKESLEGKTILLHSEQGFGDTIQFCRYVKLVAKLRAKIILEVEPALVGLLSELEGVNQIVTRGDPLPKFDFQCPLLSLPLAFNTTLETIPAPLRYVESNRTKVDTWKRKLGEKSRKRIGIAWSGSHFHNNDHNRSIAIHEILPLLSPSPSYEYISLQKEMRNSDATALESVEIKFFGNELNDFSDTAALCELVDIVISVDTSVAHLAGALGKPTWILLPYNPDWRWLLNRSDSPWYPSMTLYRQKTAGDWKTVLSELKLKIASLGS